MPSMFPPQTGICVNCGQHWTVSFPAFDVYCPQCHAVVMRLSAFNRITGALLIGAVVMVLGGRGCGDWHRNAAHCGRCHRDSIS